MLDKLTQLPLVSVFTLTSLAQTMCKLIKSSVKRVLDWTAEFKQFPV